MQQKKGSKVKQKMTDPTLVVFTDFEYLNEWMAPQWKMHQENPEIPMEEHFKKLGGYEGLSKIGTSLVQLGGVLYDMKNKKVVATINLNIQHDEKTTHFTPTKTTYDYAHMLTGVRFDEVKAITLEEGAKLLREFIGDYKWVVMNNDLNVMRHQLPQFASDRKEPIRFKPLLSNTKAVGLNSGRLYQLLTDEERISTGWNEHSVGKEHTGCYDALSMAVYSCVNNLL
jgi:hypothetical protein